MAKGKRSKQRDSRREAPESGASERRETDNAPEQQRGAVSGMPQTSPKKRERRFGHN